MHISSVCRKSRVEQTSKYLDAGLDFGRMLFIKLIPSLTVARGTYSSSFAMYFVRFSGTVYLMYPALDKKNTLGSVLPFYYQLVISYLLHGISCWSTKKIKPTFCSKRLRGGDMSSFSIKDTHQNQAFSHRIWFSINRNCDYSHDPLPAYLRLDYSTKVPSQL